MDYLEKELPEKHCNFFAVHDRNEFSAGIDAIKAESANLTDFSVALKTQQLIAKFGDSHTMLYFMPLFDSKQMLPLGLLWMSDGLYILQTTSENKELLGCRLTAINNVPILTVIDSISTMFTVDNRAVLKAQTPFFIPSVQILEFFGFVKDKQITLGLKTPKNQDIIYNIKPAIINNENAVSFKPDSLTFCFENRNAFFIDSYRSEDRIYYLLYNKCWSKEIESEYGNKDRAEAMPSFKTFEEKVFNVLKNESVDKIIFDMRYNGGGNSLQGTAFVEKLAAFLETNPHIKMYVVLGRNTFSSAILNAMDFKRLTNAVFVGEETSGKPNHFGEVRSLELPSSKLKVGYSTKYFKRTDEDVNTLTPDILLEASFSDFSKGIDPVYEWVKKQ